MVLQKGGITQYQGFYGLHLGLHGTINEICSSSGGIYDTLNRVYNTKGGVLTPWEGFYGLPGGIRRNKRGL